jgi:tetratricopeptide (TPR) repeat protein
MEERTLCLDPDDVAALVGGDLAPRDVALVETHVARCAECRALLSLVMRSDSTVESLSSARSTNPASAPRAADDSADPIPGDRVGRYELLERLGAGAMGVVFAAYDPELERKVAVKLLRRGADVERSPARSSDRLMREARAMAQLAHPNVVAVYDVGSRGDRIFIAMELVDGQTLAQWLAARRRPLDELIAMFVAAGHGLAAAHAASLVHRDFKPENVLIGRDSRARVTDFGLAHRAAVPVDPSPAAGDHSIDRGRSTAGMLAGTPFYMAPELYGGAEATARSDQFSFCVALFSALYGARPFETEPSVAAGKPGDARPRRDPQSRSRVPRRIRAAIDRGLSVDPAARFATLDELLAQLVRAPYRRTRWALGVIAALAAVAWLATRPAAAPDQRCTGAEAAFATAWSPERRGAIATAFAATRAPYASAAVERVTGALDQYAAQWIHAHNAACRATRILGEQTEPMLELRMTCLDRRRQDVAALVATFATATTATVTRAVDAAAGLTDVAACADVDALRQIVAAPADPATRAKLAELTARLADARARHATGALSPALALARPIAAEARALGYRPFEAEADLLQGNLEYDLGDTAHAQITVEAAVWAAEAGRNDRVAGFGWIRLMFLFGLMKQEFARAEALAPRVTAVIARLGGDAELEAYLERALGGLDLRQRRPAPAISHAEKAVTLAERAFGPEHFQVAQPLDALGLALLQSGQVDRAVQIQQRALQIYQRALGPDHPWVARALHNLGNADAAARRYAVAEHEIRRSLAIREAAFGPEHRDLPLTLIDLGHVLRDQGRLDEALVHDRRAVALAEKLLGPEHLILGGALFELGVDLGRLGRRSEADELLRRAQAIATKALGADSTLAMYAIAARGDLLMMRARWRDAVGLYEHALPTLETDHDAAEELATTVSQLSRAYVELDQPARALALLDRLAGALDDPAPDVAVAVAFTRARALWDTGGDRARARKLATDALAGLRGVATARPDDATQIERWLAGHRP